MKMSFRTVGLSLLLVAITSVSFAQKKNETSAAVAFKNGFLPAFAKGDMEAAKKSLISAKEFVDLAAAHPDTKDSQKTLMYKGKIYTSLAMLIAMDESLVEGLDSKGAMDIALKSLKAGYGAGKRYKTDIEEVADNAAQMTGVQAGDSFDTGNFEKAAELFYYSYRFYDVINVVDSASLFNSSLCLERLEKWEEAAKGFEQLAEMGYRGTTSALLASRSYRKVGNIEKAKEIIADALKDYPTDRDLLWELVNTNLEADDPAGAEAALNDVFAIDSMNPLLHYIIGTIYIDLKENEKAEKSLKKALELDPNYPDAQYNLGAHLVTWAGNLKMEADQLIFGDPNYNKLIQLSDETYKRALIPLEKYIVSFPEDKKVLTILYKLHHSMGNSEKALEYKRRADEATE